MRWQMVELAAVMWICKSQTKCNLILGMTQGWDEKRTNNHIGIISQVFFFFLAVWTKRGTSWVSFIYQPPPAIHKSAVYQREPLPSAKAAASPDKNVFTDTRHVRDWLEPFSILLCLLFVVVAVLDNPTWWTSAALQPASPPPSSCPPAWMNNDGFKLGHFPWQRANDQLQ